MVKPKKNKITILCWFIDVAIVLALTPDFLVPYMLVLAKILEFFLLSRRDFISSCCFLLSFSSWICLILISLCIFLIFLSFFLCFKKLSKLYWAVTGFQLKWCGRLGFPFASGCYQNTLRSHLILLSAAKRKSLITLPRNKCNSKFLKLLGDWYEYHHILNCA